MQEDPANVTEAWDIIKNKGGIPINMMPIAQMVGQPKHSILFAQALAKSDFALNGCLQAVFYQIKADIREYVAADQLVVFTSTALQGFALAAATLAKVAGFPEDYEDDLLISLTEAQMALEDDQEES